MQYIPNNNDSDEQQILEYIGVKSFSELLDIIPKKFRENSRLDIPKGISEHELIKEVQYISQKNIISEYNFMGRGVYDHYVPKLVDFIASRSEFYTSYTPYQPEVSQGTLQYLYEFQTMISNLTDMDASNASLYDGGSAVAEACSMAMSITRKNNIVVSSTIYDRYTDILKTYLSNRINNLLVIDEINGRTSMDSLSKTIDDQTACVVIQSPNKFGLLEDWKFIKENMDSNVLLIAVSDPTSLSILKSPGYCGADIYCGEGQSLGSYPSFGGPILGLISCRQKYVRKMPGRIIGRTKDIDGKDGFVLTLQTREQHIRRDKATSNICTNQGLLALRATIYMSLLGKYGLSKVADLSFKNAQYAYKEILKLDNFTLPYDDQMIKEFVVRYKGPIDIIVSDALKENIFIEPINEFTDCNSFILCFTEKKTKENIDHLINFLARY